MKISIITSTFNCGILFKYTANSIRNQLYRNFEWIVVDGMSSDDTNFYIKENKDLISILIQEVDIGIYDAWNKACRYISGDWIIFLGAGDSLIDENVLLSVNAYLENISQDVCLIYGNVQVIDKFNNLRYVDTKKDLNKFKYGRPVLPNHQGVFHHKSLFNTQGKVFDDSLKISADSKFLLQSFKLGNYDYINLDITKMVYGGISTNYKNIFVVRKEIAQICKELNIKVPFIFYFLSEFNWFFLFFYKLFIPHCIQLFLRRFFDICRNFFHK